MTNWYGSLWFIWRTNAATQDSLPILPDTPYIHVIMRPLGHPNENCQKLEWTNKEGNMKIPCKLNKKDVTTKPTLVLYAYFSKTWVISCLRCCNLLSWDLPSSKLSPLCVTIIYKLIYSIPMLSVYAHLLNLYVLLPFSIIPHHCFLQSQHDFQSSPLSFIYLPWTSMSGITITWF